MNCMNGHSLDDGNLYVNPRGDRVCRECRRQAAARYYDQNRDKVLETMRNDYAANPTPRLEARREYHVAHPEAARRAKCARKARKLNAFVEHVEPLVVLERADGVCGVCDTDVDPFVFDVDHIIPLSKGGEHSYQNVQPAHPICNRQKGASF